jgi:hypothetical protein
VNASHAKRGTPQAFDRAAPTRRRRLLPTVIAVLLCAAPVPGDIGSCGQPVQRLDPIQFFGKKKTIDCLRCNDCGIETTACVDACKRAVPAAASFPQDCSPLVHDGEVCLRALLDASCDDYATYVADVGPVVPTECNFCPGAPP